MVTPITSERLALSDFLGHLRAEERKALAALGQGRTYDKGDHLFRADDPGTYVYILETGRIKIYQHTSMGKDVILWFCLPGEIFGLAEVTLGGERAVNALACEVSAVLQVPQEAFKGFVASRPSVALLVMQILSSRLRGLSNVIANVIADDVNTRITKLILRLGARYGRREGSFIHLDIPLTHQEIADMVGTTRQTVTTALSQMKRQGMLSIDRRRILIESEELLSNLTEE